MMNAAECQCERQSTERIGPLFSEGRRPPSWAVFLFQILENEKVSLKMETIGKHEHYLEIKKKKHNIGGGEFPL